MKPKIINIIEPAKGIIKDEDIDPKDVKPNNISVYPKIKEMNDGVLKTLKFEIVEPCRQEISKNTIAVLNGIGGNI